MKIRSCKPRNLLLSLVILITLTTFGFSLAAEFSADFYVKTTGEDDVKGKIFVKGNKIRQEVTEEGDTQIMIIRPDKNVTWMITPGEKMYMEIPYESDSQSVEPWTPEKEKSAKYLGEETVNGHAAKKYEIVEEGEKVTYWVSKKLNFPVKIEDSESVMEYRNIKEGSVADSHFEVPSGYEKMTMPVMPNSPDASKP